MKYVNTMRVDGFQDLQMIGSVICMVYLNERHSLVIQIFNTNN